MIYNIIKEYIFDVQKLISILIIIIGFISTGKFRDKRLNEGRVLFKIKKYILISFNAILLTIVLNVVGINLKLILDNYKYEDVIIGVTTLILLFIFCSCMILILNSKEIELKYKARFKGDTSIKINNKTKLILELGMLIEIGYNFIIIKLAVYLLLLDKFTIVIVGTLGILVIINFMNFNLYKEYIFIIEEIEAKKEVKFIMDNNQNISCSIFKENSESILIYNSDKEIKITKSKIMNQITKNKTNNKYSECYVDFKCKNNKHLRMVNRLRRTEIYQLTVF